MNHQGSTVSVLGRWKAKYADWRSAQIFRRETVRAIKGIIREQRITPRVSRYLSIPSDAAPWPNRGIQLDEPTILLSWGESEKAITAKLEAAGVIENLSKEGRAWSDIHVLFLGYDLRLYLNYEYEYHDPHFERTLGSGSLMGLPNQLPQDYATVQQKLIHRFGMPTHEKPVSADSSDYARSVWTFAFAEIEHAVEVFYQDNVPFQSIRLRRKLRLDLETASVK